MNIRTIRPFVVPLASFQFVLTNAWNVVKINHVVNTTHSLCMVITVWRKAEASNGDTIVCSFFGSFVPYVFRNDTTQRFFLLLFRNLHALLRFFHQNPTRYSIFLSERSLVCNELTSKMDASILRWYNKKGFPTRPDFTQAIFFNRLTPHSSSIRFLSHSYFRPIFRQW